MSVSRDDRPYKGLESYQTQDADLFFGRELEAEQIIAKILSSRMTLLHAQSGAGKTSLLNALIIPTLECKGWIPVRAQPLDDPVLSICNATVQTILPPPEAEYQAVFNACEKLAVPQEAPISALLRQYDLLPHHDPRRRELLRPVKLRKSDSTISIEHAHFAPFFCRVLRSSIDEESFIEHLAAIAWDAKVEWPLLLTRGVIIKELLEILREDSVIHSYHKLFESLGTCGAGLATFFGNLITTYGARRHKFSLVLLLDQFEELFTRFVDPGPSISKVEGPSWRLRLQFFYELEKLYHARIQDMSTAGSVLPIRYIISMRDEYIAQLVDAIRAFEPQFNTYHLLLLTRDQAGAAIRKPAHIFGYRYSDNCYHKIINQLVKEEQFVEPTHLQLVCDKIWIRQGKNIARPDASTVGSQNTPEISIGVLDDLKGVPGILGSFLKEYLDGLDQVARFETLEMLEALVTKSRTRNIVDEKVLLYPPLRENSRRTDLLGELVKRSIVRIEGRLGGRFAEITHEFLIVPVLDEVRDFFASNPKHGRFQQAVNSLERYSQAEMRPLEAVLWLGEFQVLHEKQKHIAWDARSVEVMARSAIYRGFEDRNVLKYWLKLRHELQSMEVFDEKNILSEGRTKILSYAELEFVNKGREALKVTATQIELLLKSELQRARDDDRNDVAYWARRMSEHV